MSQFPYRKDAKGDYFPIIELVISFQNRFVRTSALIDSGATTSIFRPDIADQLGIKIEKGKEVYLSGVGGRIKGYLHELKIEAAGRKFISPIIFSYEYTVSLNLLGREGFFKNFVIVFDERKKKLELR
jgi:hypothetical protein